MIRRKQVKLLIMLAFSFKVRNQSTDPLSGCICINILITHREDFFLTLGFGISGVQGTALSPIHCSRGESVPFGFTSCGRHRCKT